jgi:hypothetical protein
MVVLLGAQAHPLDAGGTCPFVQGGQELPADALAAVTVPDRDSQFGRRLIDEAVAVIGLGEQPAPGRPEPLAVALRDDAEITVATPPDEVALRLGSSKDQLGRRVLAIGPPEGGRIEHLGLEGRIVCREITDGDDRRHGAGQTLAAAASRALAQSFLNDSMPLSVSG